ncbi:MAG: endonuclease III [Spirochaetales bacterium]|jgi:endonuclease-3|nr:endonuclease III [Spirochaetales bacterium]
MDAKAETLRAKKIHGVLLKSYPEIKPLLNFRSPFELLVAVILSAQTSDPAVNAVTPALFRRFPGAEALAAAPQEEVEALVHSLGFYRVKALHIRQTARKLLDDYAGEVPDTMEELVKLPGAGRKTAGLILYQIYGKPAIIVDTHFSRVVLRLGFTENRDPAQTEKTMAAVLPQDIRSSFSMRINRHGRAVCAARKPACESCCLKSLCAMSIKQV